MSHSDPRATAPSTEARARQAVVALRVAVALLLVVHGAARASLGIVDDLGAFLGDVVGLPGGAGLAWMITTVEIVGGATLAAGRLVRPLCIWFAVELAAGILLVHAPEGWFVVGAGRNGMEYSVLLIVALLCVGWVGAAER